MYKARPIPKNFSLKLQMLLKPLPDGKGRYTPLEDFDESFSIQS